jgi:hypothetical protein
LAGEKSIARQAAVEKRRVDSAGDSRDTSEIDIADQAFPGPVLDRIIDQPIVA